jgi:hypothetical protein
VSEKGKEIPTVDVELFERAFAAFREALCNDASEDREIGGMAAVYEVTARSNFKSVCARCFKLLDVIRASDDVCLHKRFPTSWLTIAASAPVHLLGEFDAALFAWREEEIQ